MESERTYTAFEGQRQIVSGTLRRLVDEERKRGHGQELARNAGDATHKFMWAMTGNLPDFEEASRALFAGDAIRLKALIKEWPDDIRHHVERLVDEYVGLESQSAGGGP